MDKISHALILLLKIIINNYHTLNQFFMWETRRDCQKLMSNTVEWTKIMVGSGLKGYIVLIVN